MMLRTYYKIWGNGRGIRLKGKTVVKKRLISKDANITRSVGLDYVLVTKTFFRKKLSHQVLTNTFFVIMGDKSLKNKLVTFG